MNTPTCVLTRPVVVSALLAGVLNLGGCVDEIKAPLAARPDTIAANQYPQITVDAGLHPYVGVQYAAIVVEPATSERPLRVSVPVRSLWDAPMAIQYEFVWLDTRGGEVGRTGPMFQFMDPRLEKQVSGNAMTLSASAWRLELRPSR